MMSYCFTPPLGHDSCTATSRGQALPKDLSDEDEFVPPKQITTTFTKQAEISPTEKFVSTKKVNLVVTTPATPAGSAHQLAVQSVGVKLRTKSEASRGQGSDVWVEPGFVGAEPRSTETGGREQQKLSRSKRTAFYWTDGVEDCQPLTGASHVTSGEMSANEQWLERPDGKAHLDSPGTDAAPLATHVHAPAAAAGPKRRRMLLSVTSDVNPGVRFVLSNDEAGQTTKDGAERRKILASSVVQSAAHVLMLDTNPTAPYSPASQPNELFAQNRMSSSLPKEFSGYSEGLSSQCDELSSHMELSSQYLNLCRQNAVLISQHPDLSPHNMQLFQPQKEFSSQRLESSPKCPELSSLHPEFPSVLLELSPQCTSAFSQDLELSEQHMDLSSQCEDLPDLSPQKNELSADSEVLPSHCNNLLLQPVCGGAVSDSRVVSRAIDPSSLLDSSSHTHCSGTFASSNNPPPSRTRNDVPKIWPSLTPMPQQLWRRGERRKDVLTNGSLLKPAGQSIPIIPLSQGLEFKGHNPPQTFELSSKFHRDMIEHYTTDVSTDSEVGSAETKDITRASTRESVLENQEEVLTKQSDKCSERSNVGRLSDTSGNTAWRRPNTLDIATDSQQQQAAMISPLLRPTLGMVITPDHTPTSCGLVNPGFVFEFPLATNSLSGDDSGGEKPVPSPSLLDVLHKKHWANSSPSSTLSRKHCDDVEMSYTDSTVKTSVFRSRHESYCRVVDQNSDDKLMFQTQNSDDRLAFQTLPSKGSSADKAMRMFGDVSQMFNTLPVRHSPEHQSKSGHQSSPEYTSAVPASVIAKDKMTGEQRGRAISEPRRPGAEIDVGGVQRVGSAGKLSNLTVSFLPTTTSSTKLTRKFSLSPRILRRKIIAKFQSQQPELQTAGSSESEADDQTTTVTSVLLPRIYMDNLQAKKKLELGEIEALEACAWLEQAGFPQYVQLFEDSQFPIDLDAVQKDHSFLEEQQLRSLFRRLNTLNKSVHMKLDINNKKTLYTGAGGSRATDEDEEEEACSISDKWHYERASGRWSHIDAATATTAATDASSVSATAAKMRSCSSRDSVMTDETVGEDMGDSPSSPVLQSKNLANNDRLLLTVPLTEQSQSDSGGESSSPSPMGQQIFDKRSKQRNGSFFQRHVGSLTRRTSNKGLKRTVKASTPLISGPTLVNTPDMTERIQKLGCVEINSRMEDIYNNNNTSKGSTRSAVADYCSCDTCSVGSTASSPSAVTQYILPPDYIIGTFPKQLLESEIPSRPNSISSHNRRCHASNHNNTANTMPCTKRSKRVPMARRTEQRRHSNDSNQTINVDKRCSIYDNLSVEEDLDVTTNSTLASHGKEARKELDAVLHDLLINITNLDLDNDGGTVTDSLYDSLAGRCKSAVQGYRPPQVDSAIVSPTSEELSSLAETPSESGTTPADTPELKRSSSFSGGGRQADVASIEELATSGGEHLPEEDEEEEEEGEEDREDDSIREMQETIWRERRDSGVGSSLTREPMERKKKVRLRWHSFVASHRPSFNSQNQHISSLSAGQLMYLKRLSLLKVTSLMEQYSPSHKSGGFSLQLVNRFIKKGSRTPDYNNKKVFGVPLFVTLQRTGQPLPQAILHAMRYLRKSAPDAVGIFRKSGVKSRIQKLRNDLEQDPDNVAQFDSMQSYDVADMFKQYLRELPECLVTNKLSDTFLAIYQHVPSELRLEALQACSLLLPDENREVLESLLYFLSDMASYHEDNQMTASNLAMCFAPSLFNIHNRSSQSKSPKSAHKNSPGIPDQKEFQEQRSATDCLTSMIVDCKKVFRIPEDFLSKCSSSSSYMDAGEPAPLSLLGAGPDYQAHVDSCLHGLLKESKDKGWTSVPSLLTLSTEDSVELSYKKVHDSNPLRLWKCSIEVEAPPPAVLNRVLHERQKWDEDLVKWRTVEKLDTHLDVFQYVCTSMAPQPSREYLILRAWKQDLPKGACALVMHSIDHEVSSLGGGIRGIVLASHYFIEPCGPGRSKLTHISRIDARGRQAKWYNRSYGSLAANNLTRVKESFNKTGSVDVHETKV